ncbi:MAG TPA: cache domain-containing protein [Paucimonas sp.]|nr:cache domain-containing protein [Paucimonas sp.]
MIRLLKWLVVGLSIVVLQPATAGERGTPDEAIAMVKRAAAYVKEHGKDKAFAEFNNPKGQFVDRDMYIFAFLANGDGIERANGANIKLVGKYLLDLKDADGKFMVREFFEVANGKGRGWVDYKWPNPVTKTIEAKSTYIEKVDDVILGCGIYK